jgi:hypothetical protein
MAAQAARPAVDATKRNAVVRSVEFLNLIFRSGEIVARCEEPLGP